MNTLFCLIAALIAVSGPVTEITGSAYKGLETAWAISYKAAQIVLEERVANQGEEEKDEDISEESEVADNSSGHTEADIAYWNDLAHQYGFQAYNGFGDFSQFVESAQQFVNNAQAYGDLKTIQRIKYNQLSQFNLLHQNNQYSRLLNNVIKKPTPLLWTVRSGIAKDIQSNIL